MRIDSILKGKQTLREILLSLESYKTIVDCGRNSKVIYASSAITTGRKMYDLFEEYGVSSVDELNKLESSLFNKKILKKNIHAAVQFGKKIRKKYSGAQVIAPAAYYAKGWTQREYMEFGEQ